MLLEMKNKSSLTFYSKPSFVRNNIPEYTNGLINVSLGNIALTSAIQTNIYNIQLDKYVFNCAQIRQTLTKQALNHISDISLKYPNPNASLLRDTNSWKAVKIQVVREELMKLQISGKTDLPISKSEIQKIKLLIKDKDLTIELADRITEKVAMGNDEELKSIFNKIISYKSEGSREFMDAFKLLKNTGKVSDCLQIDKISELQRELDKIDLSKITDKQWKRLLKNYCEVNEFHHRDSISNDPIKQNNPDNIDVLKTSKHNSKHTHDGKIDYTKPTNETPLDRKSDMIKGNKRRIFKNELKGLGIAVAIAAGIGFALSFVLEMATNGIGSENIESILVNSTKAGLEAGVISSATYGAGRITTELIKKAGVDLTTKIGGIINMAAVGTLSIAIVSTIQFVKLKMKGDDTYSALKQVSKQAAFSLSVLTVSIIAQGIWGGHAGIIVSLSIGVVFMVTTVVSSRQKRELSDRLQIYSIEHYKILALN